MTPFHCHSGESFTGRFAVSLVFELHDGPWGLLHGHYSMLPDQRR
jgi:hypothetical protein